MMQTAQPWHRNNSTTSSGLACGFPTYRRSFRQCQMRSVVVIVTDVLIHKAFQVALIQHDHMVKQISPAVTHESLGDAVLPWALETGPFGLDAEGLKGGNNFFAKAGSSIEDQVAGRRVVRERLTQLLHHPGTGWMPGGVEV